MEKEKHTVHRFSNFVIRKRKWIEKIFAVAVVLSIIALCFVRVNYDSVSYTHLAHAPVLAARPRTGYSSSVPL